MHSILLLYLLHNLFKLFYFLRQIALRALSERLSKVEQVPWPSASDEAKHSDKSKTVSITMPQILAHHQSSALMPHITSVKLSSSTGVETDKLTTSTESRQPSSN